MVNRVGRILLAGLCLAAPAVARPPGGNRPPPAEIIASDAVGRRHLLPADLAVLDNPEFKWKHLQTRHFIVHYQRRMFAARMARMGEQFLAAIAADLPDLRDHAAPGRSHIFIFRDPRDWTAIVAQTPGLDAWAASFVRGQTMYLQELGTATSDKMEVLAHEMTHLVFNRFLPVRLPLWLNEGLAEYYGEFAYRAAKGMGQSKRQPFRPLRRWTPVPELLSATDYPADPDEVALFYTTSKYLVGFLLLKQPRGNWTAFFDRVLSGEDAAAALLDAFGWADTTGLERDFSGFVR